MSHPLQCRCGAVRGHVDTERSGGRAVCYCRDCQSFARFLGREDDILDDKGGTEVVATLPRSVHITAGADQVACMSLSGKGLLRWYAACCRTPIGNTPRDRKVSYVGLVRACLPGSDAELAKAFGPLEVVVNTGSARGRVEKKPLAMFFAVLKILRNVVGARVTGGYRVNPFFGADAGEPVKTPQVLTLAERQALAVR